MRKFLRDVAFFVVFCTTISLVNFLPGEFYTYRNWEALSYSGLGRFSYGAFYRNKSTQRSEYGDLAHHSDFELRKDDVVWRTDRLGHRNDEFFQRPDVVLVGDSNLVGSGVGQDDTLVNLLNRVGRRRAYSIAPKGMQDLVNMMAYRVIEAPKIVVFESVERTVLRIPTIHPVEPTLLGAVISRIRLSRLASFVSEAIDKVYSQRAFRYLAARLEGASGLDGSIQSRVDPSFFFRATPQLPSEADVEAVAAELIRYRDFLGERGIDFVFLPVPDKRTVYPELASLEDRVTMLPRLIEELKAAEVHVVDTFELFVGDPHDGLLYFKDDSHWNERAIRLVYEELDAQLDLLIGLSRSLPSGP